MGLLALTSDGHQRTEGESLRGRKPQGETQKTHDGELQKTAAREKTPEPTTAVFTRELKSPNIQKYRKKGGKHEVDMGGSPGGLRACTATAAE